VLQIDLPESRGGTAGYISFDFEDILHVQLQGGKIMGVSTAKVVVIARS